MQKLTDAADRVSSAGRLYSEVTRKLRCVSDLVSGSYGELDNGI